MIKVELADVLAVLELCKPYIIGIVAAIIVTTENSFFILCRC